MEWIDRLNNAIDYIEENLTEEIDYDKIAKIAMCSGYYFQRMFSYMSEMTLSEYIRRRRMSKAAMELSNGAKVIDVAIKYCYDSPTAFNRAFQKLYNMPPSELKHQEKIYTNSFCINY